MTEKRNNDRLDALYREAGDVEPEAGLDRIIRARASEAAQTRRSASRLPWLGGLVTASVAVVAIAVILQQSPPSGQLRESFAPEESDRPEAYMAPSMGAQSQLEVSADTRATARERGEEGVSPERAAALKAPRPLSDVDTDSVKRQATSAEAQAEPELRPAAPPAGQNDAGSVVVAGSRIIADDQADPDARDDVIEELRKLIKEQRLEDARRLLKDTVEIDPEFTIPKDIKQALHDQIH